jgi:hypothetical protein
MTRNCHVPFWRAVEEVTSSLTLIIAALGVPVDAPEGSGLSCSLDDHLRAIESPRHIVSA